MFDVFGFYKFKNITNLKKNKNILKKLFFNHNVKGTIIISKEGINGTLSGKKKELRTSSREKRRLQIRVLCVEFGIQLENPYPTFQISRILPEKRTGQTHLRLFHSTVYIFRVGRCEVQTKHSRPISTGQTNKESTKTNWIKL